MVVNQDKNNVEEIEVKGGHHNQRWKNVPDQVKQNWIKKNESQTTREVIFHRIPSPKTYEEGTAFADAKHVFGILDELKTLNPLTSRSQQDNWDIIIKTSYQLLDIQI